MVVLASVMSGEGNGIQDEFFTLYRQAEEAQLDEYGRGKGTYLLATRGWTGDKNILRNLKYKFARNNVLERPEWR